MLPALSFTQILNPRMEFTINKKTKQNNENLPLINK